MADPLSDERREGIWETLSNAFVDNEADFQYIASKVSDVSPVELEEIFFTEVAPHCGSNLMSPIPPVWAGFERVELAKNIRIMQARNQGSWIARLRHKGIVTYCRWRFRKEWRAIVNEFVQRDSLT